MENITGFVESIVFQNKENGYTVLYLNTDEEVITCVGFCIGLTQGESIEASGEYTEHATYGRQFKISSFHTVRPTDVAQMERYLASGAVKGIGATLATRIIKSFGKDTMRIIEEEPERLAEVKGISLRKAQEIAVQFDDKKELREAMLFLQPYGISNRLAIRIYETYGTELYTVLRENPYRLAEDVNGVGFRTADEIAQKSGIHTDSEYRIRSGIYYALTEAVLQRGHCYLPMEELIEASCEVLGVDAERIGPQLDNLMMDQKIIRKGDQIFPASYYYAEAGCAQLLSQLNLHDLKGELLPAEEAALRARLEKMAADLSMEVDELQLQAVETAIRNGVFLLLGGPGTGKTTTINMIIRYFEAEGLDILLAAPTGRAAKRMTEATGFEARTIHRLLEVSALPEGSDGRGARYERNGDNPLEADVIIIDEMSMVDVLLFRALLRAILPGTRLILVGDVDQLPSVGPGQVLRDLRDSGAFPQVSLHRIFRQAGGSDIVQNAHRINHGEHIPLDTKSKDFLFLERSDTNVIYKHMVELIRDRLPAYVEATPFDIQVLTPMRKGALGCIQLNSILQQMLNPAAREKKEYLSGDTLFREGDKVMQIHNNYQLEWEIVGKYNIPIDSGMGVFNGDMGRVLEINEAASLLTVEFDDGRRVRYPFMGLDELELAYAITIHKSQGSEYPAVVMPLMGGPQSLCNRNLLYTGITRAKRCVTILGSSEAIYRMVDNVGGNRRYTALAQRIRESAGLVKGE